MGLKNTYKKSLPHVLAWGMFVFVNFFVFYNPQLGANYNFRSQLYIIPVIILYVVLYYTNIKFLIPIVLFKQNYIRYIISLLISMSIMIVVATYFRQNEYRATLKYRIITESSRVDITAYRKNKNIRKWEDGIEYSYDPTFYLPFNRGNMPVSYGTIVIILSGIAFSYIERWKKREILVVEMNKEKVESELAYLKQQINPHFLFNSLNSIYSLVLPHSEKASDVVLKLSTILRYMLYETNQDKISVTKEVEIMIDYIELNKLKYLDTSDILYSFDGDFSGLVIEPLITIPFIENAFKYGTNNNEKSYMRISLRYEKGELVFYIENKILNEIKSKEHSGIGIKNISRRLEIIYDDKHSMKIVNKNGLFSVKLKIPVERLGS